MSEDSQILNETEPSPVAAASDEIRDVTDGPTTKSFVLAELDGDVAATNALAGQQGADAIGQLRIEFAATRIPLEDVERWQPGRLIKFDEPHSATVRVFIGKALVAQGELVDVAGQIGVRVLERMEPVEDL